MTAERQVAVRASFHSPSVQQHEIKDHEHHEHVRCETVSRIEQHRGHFRDRPAGTLDDIFRHDRKAQQMVRPPEQFVENIDDFRGVHVRDLGGDHLENQKSQPGQQQRRSQHQHQRGDPGLPIPALGQPEQHRPQHDVHRDRPEERSYEKLELCENYQPDRNQDADIKQLPEKSVVFPYRSVCHSSKNGYCGSLRKYFTNFSVKTKTKRKIGTIRTERRFRAAGNYPAATVSPISSSSTSLLTIA